MRVMHKFTILLGSLVIISSLIQFFLFNMVFVKNADAMYSNINKKAASNINDRLSDHFTRIVNSLEKVALHSNLWRNQALLAQESNTVPELDMILVLDKRGHVLYTSQGRNAFDDVNFESEDYFQRALKGTTYINPVVTNIQGLQVITIATPIIEQGHIEGVVLGAVTLQRNAFASLFGNKAFGRNTYIVIADSQGIIIFHPDSRLIGTQLAEIDKLRGSSGSLILPKYDGEDRYVGYRHNPNSGFLTIVYSPTTDVTQLRNMMVYQDLTLSVITVLVIITLGTYTIRLYMRPFQELTKTFATLRKGQYTEITPSRHAEEFSEIIEIYNNTVRELEAFHNKLRGDANVDGLTGAFNHRAFIHAKELLDIEINSLAINSLSLVLIDFDNFKHLNDTQGHLAGDDILKEFTSLAAEILAPFPLFRYGGDEFVAILRNLPRDKVIKIAEQVRQRTEQTLRGCTISIGIATYPENAHSANELFDLADQALYISKDTNNQVTAYPVS